MHFGWQYTFDLQPMMKHKIKEGGSATYVMEEEYRAITDCVYVSQFPDAKYTALLRISISSDR